MTQLVTTGLDRLQAAVWPKALRGDTKAVDTARRLIVSRCKILGLEAPRSGEEEIPE